MPPSTVTSFEAIPFLVKLIVAITSWFVNVVVLYVTSAIGNTLSIHVTFASAEPVFPAASLNSNVKLPLFINVYVSFPSLFVIVISSLASSNVATTFPFVGLVTSYFIFAVGTTLSIQFTVAVTLPLFPALSANSKVKVPFSVNVYVFLPLLFNIKTSPSGSFSKTTPAVTSWFVDSIVLYTNNGSGTSLSIHVTTAFATPEFPAGPVNWNSYSPFLVNVCVFPPSTVTSSLSNVIVATTSLLVFSVAL